MICVLLGASCMIRVFDFLFFLILVGFLEFRSFCVGYRLLQTVLFLTESVFRVLFAYFDAFMASKIVYKP